MTYPLPSIFIQPSRRADLAAERRDTEAFNAWASRPENGRARLAEVVL